MKELHTFRKFLAEGEDAGKAYAEWERERRYRSYDDMSYLNDHVLDIDNYEYIIKKFQSIIEKIDAFQEKNAKASFWGSAEEEKFAKNLLTWLNENEDWSGLMYVAKNTDQPFSHHYFTAKTYLVKDNLDLNEVKKFLGKAITKAQETKATM